jgi:hypothetical protein
MLIQNELDAVLNIGIDKRPSRRQPLPGPRQKDRAVAQPPFP